MFHEVSLRRGGGIQTIAVAFRVFLLIPKSPSLYQGKEPDKPSLGIEKGLEKTTCFIR
jgi:hypothetical protein